MRPASHSQDPATLAVELATLRATVVALAERVNQLELERTRARVPAVGRRAISADDRQLLAVLLPAIVGAVGDSAWTVDDLKDDVAAGALAQLGGSPRRLGRLLARAAGVDIDGYRVRQVGVVRTGALWAVTPVPSR